MIPKIIHQLWIGPKSCPRILMDTWQKMNPGWDYMCWDEKAIGEHFTSGLRNQKQFDEMEELCGKCDVARIEILNSYGGFFIDADSVCLQPLDDFLLLNDSFTCYENEFERANLLACGYLASTPDNALMRLLIDAVSRIDVQHALATPNGSPFNSENRAWQLTGSGLLTSTVFKNKYTSISIYPSYYFIPEHYSGATYRGFGKSYSRQLWGSTAGSSFYGYNFANLPTDTLQT